MTNSCRWATNAVVAGAFMSVAVLPAVADDDEEIPFDEADVYAELNDTDGDLGFHALADGEGWRLLAIEDPNERTILRVRPQGRLRRQGLTELFFESAEPTFDEFTPAEFFMRFPEGIYEIEGMTAEREELESEDVFSHVMPAQPGLQGDGSIVIHVNGMADTVIRAECDDEDPAFSPLSVSGPTVTLAWDPVESSHPTIGRNGDITVARYQAVAEIDLEVDDDEFTAVFSVDLPPDVTSMTIPEQFIGLGDEFKYEILVKEATGGNQTAVESCFVVE